MKKFRLVKNAEEWIWWSEAVHAKCPGGFCAAHEKFGAAKGSDGGPGGDIAVKRKRGKLPPWCRSGRVKPGS